MAQITIIISLRERHMSLKLLQMDYGSPKHRPVCLSIETLQHVLIGTMNAGICIR